jgi:hypothetical protein
MLIEQSFLFVCFSSLVIAKERSTHHCFLLVTAFHHPSSHFSITKERSAHHYFLLAITLQCFPLQLLFVFFINHHKEKKLTSLFPILCNNFFYCIKFFHLNFFFGFVCDLFLFIYLFILIVVAMVVSARNALSRIIIVFLIHIILNLLEM